MAKTTNTLTALRRNLRAAFGHRMYKITAAGEVHVMGQMPNTNSIGWYLFGDADKTETHARAAQLAA